MSNFDLLDENLAQNEEVFIGPRASQGQRFTNYIIDRICLYGLTMGAGFILGIVLVMLDSPLMDRIAEDDGTDLLVRGLDILLGLIVAVIFYTLMEYYTGGKTVGKYVSKTRALRTDDAPLTFHDALMRSLCRIVPFDAVSFLFGDDTGWHDKWTDTKVIKDFDTGEKRAW